MISFTLGSVLPSDIALQHRINCLNLGRGNEQYKLAFGCYLNNTNNYYFEMS